MACRTLNNLALQALEVLRAWKADMQQQVAAATEFASRRVRREDNTVGWQVRYCEPQFADKLRTIAGKLVYQHALDVRRGALTKANADAAAAWQVVLRAATGAANTQLEQLEERVKVAVRATFRVVA